MNEHPEVVDTDEDSWDSGDNQPDFPDTHKYDGEVSDKIVPDEGDEDNLGNKEADEIVGLTDKFEPLDDEEIDDRGFDCD
ncbi:MAG: hypothetical protein Q4E47_00135 [Candidatus Saccharibacteria bacterium]|nr:hypothetical protein [Candidatus Saccharibacteria bacterium]